MKDRLREQFGIDLFTEVSGKALAIFRIGFGVIMLYEIMNMRLYVLNDLLDSKYFLTYDFFSWIKPFSYPVMEVLLTLGTIAALFVIIGYKYRIAQLMVALVWTYVFLMDKGHYNNHYYLFSMLNFALVFTDSHHNYSLAALIAKPQLPTKVYRWQYLVVQFHVFVVYFFGAIAKMNSDWLAGWPLRNWLTHGLDQFPDWYGDFVTSDFGVYFYAYGGVLFDLTVGFALFHRKWRYRILPVLVFFHVSNHFLWNIGTFPWFSILVTSMFFEPDWPEAIMKRFGINSVEKLSVKPTIGPLKRNVITVVLGLCVAVQMLAPLRQFVYKGNPGWHGYGQFFSWRMMLVDMTSGVQFKIKDEGDSEFVYVAIEDYITFRQFRKSARVPDSFLDFAHFLRDEMKRGGAKDPIVEMRVYKSFNGRPYTLFNDTTLNYAKIEKTYFQVPDWILPGNANEAPGQLWQID